MEQSFLIFRGTPATVDEKLDPRLRGSGRSLAQVIEERWIEVGHTRNVVVEDRRAVGDETVSRPERTPALSNRRAGGDGTVRFARCTEVAAADDGQRSGVRRGDRRGRPQLAPQGGPHRDEKEQEAEDTDPATPPGRSCWFAVGHDPSSSDVA